MSRETAKELLVHYFGVANDRCVGSDCPTEIESIVDSIIDAAVDQAKTELGTKMTEALEELRTLNLAQREQNRLLAACSALKGLLGNGTFATAMGLKYEPDDVPAVVVVSAVRYADALIAVLDSTKGT